MSEEYTKAQLAADAIENFSDFGDWLESQGWRLHRPPEDSAVDGCVEGDEFDWTRLIFKFCGVDYDKYMEETVPVSVDVELPDDPV